LQRASRAHAKIGLLGDIRNLDGTPNPAVGSHLEGDLVAQIDELKAGLQLMVSVGAPADDM
jgi:hypothetical protein